MKIKSQNKKDTGSWDCREEIMHSMKTNHNRQKKALET